MQLGWVDFSKEVFPADRGEAATNVTSNQG